MHTQSLQLCLTLCDPMDCSSPGSSVRGILQARILEWVAFPDPGMEPMSLMSPALAGGFFTTRAAWEAPQGIQGQLKVFDGWNSSSEKNKTVLDYNPEHKTNSHEFILI